MDFQAQASSRQLLDPALLRAVRREHVLAAIVQLDKGMQTGFAKSTKYDLVTSKCVKTAGCDSSSSSGSMSMATRGWPLMITLERRRASCLSRRPAYLPLKALCFEAQ
jgi:hypothetical protein